MAHALLSASAAYMWLICTLMPRFTQGLKDTAGEAAKEGSHAHEIAEWTLRGLLGMNSSKFVKNKLKTLKDTKWPKGSKKEGKEIYDAEMSRHVAAYVTYVMEQYSEALAVDPNAKIFLERVVRFDKYIKEGFGTADVLIVYSRKLRGIDLKYGKGKFVEAEDNSQLKIYALGGALEFDEMFDFDFFEMTIYQPRLDYIGTMEISREALIDWARYTLKPKADLAWAGKGEFVAGDHCGFCKALAVCPEVKKKMLALAAYKFAANEFLSDEAVVDSYLLAPLLSAWESETKRYALRQTLEHGKKWPGLILTNGRSNRRYKDEESVVERLRGLKFTEDQFYKKAIVGIGDMEKLLGGRFNEILDGLIEKAPGQPTLVPDDGKREKYSKIKGKFKQLN